MEYSVRCTWDEEAQVWVAESDDIPGLVLESGSIDALIERVRYTAPELLELNSVRPSLQSDIRRSIPRSNPVIPPTPS